MWKSIGLFTSLTMALSLPAAAQPVSAPTIQALRAGMAGAWQGKLEYRDYQADRWFGLPVRVSIELVGDGVTLIRKADFDDGPATGIVRITTVGLFDPATSSETAASFRAGKTTELATSTLTLVTATDPTHWTLREECTGTDDDRPARLRETTTRDGATVTTLKEVDFLDDAGEQWLSRNRTILNRLP